MFGLFWLFQIVYLNGNFYWSQKDRLNNYKQFIHPLILISYRIRQIRERRCIIETF